AYLPTLSLHDALPILPTRRRGLHRQPGHRKGRILPPWIGTGHGCTGAGRRAACCAAVAASRAWICVRAAGPTCRATTAAARAARSEEHTSELQSRFDL